MHPPFLFVPDAHCGPLMTSHPDLDATEDHAPLRGEAGGPRAAFRSPSRIQKTSILGDFRLLAKLGEGGMGSVYRARQISRPRDVALKVLAKELAGRPDAVERFLREARLTAR